MEVQHELIKEKGILRLSNYDADSITNILAEHHKKDVFISQCKNGETWGARDLLKLDAWVLCRTYSPLTTIGYEIKTSRSDFENDQKWTSYLDLCHLFYFVCPAGMIRSVDLPSQVGLIWVSNSGKLHTKRKSEYKEPEPNKQNRLLIYALMARAKIVSNEDARGIYPEAKSSLEVAKEFIERAEHNKELYYLVNGHIKKIYEELNRKNNLFSSREDRLKRFEQQLAKLGITWDSHSDNWQDNQKVENEINALKGHLDIWALRNLRDTGTKMIRCADELEKYYKNGG